MLDFSNVQETKLIPANTVAKARFTLKPGDSPENPYLKVSRNGGTYLDGEFTITEGEYVKRKVFHKIGISGNETWVEISQQINKNLLESANGISRFDKSPESDKHRKIESWSELDGLDVILVFLTNLLVIRLFHVGYCGGGVPDGFVSVDKF